MTKKLGAASEPSRKRGRKPNSIPAEHMKTIPVRYYISPHELSQVPGGIKVLQAHGKEEVAKHSNAALRKAHLKEAARLQAEQVTKTTKTVSGEWD